LKRILTLAAACISLLILISLIIPFFIPTSTYKAQIEKAASQSLGVSVRIEGPLSLRLFPNLSARVQDIEIENPEGFESDTLLSASSLRVRLRLWPLLTQKFIVKQLTLDDLDLRVERLEDGRSNLLALAQASLAQTEADSPEKDEANGTDLAFNQVQLRRATIRLKDALSARQFLVTDFDGNLRFTGADQPARSNGQGQLNGQPLAYTFRITTPQSLSQGQPTSLDLSVDTELVSFAYKGDVQADQIETSRLNGKFSLESTSLDFILSMAPSDLPEIIRLAETFKASGTISGALADRLEIDLEQFQLGTEAGDLDFAGQILLPHGEMPDLTGQYDISLDQPARLLRTLPFTLPVRSSAFNRVEMKGRIAGPVSGPELQIEKSRLSAEGLSANYTGRLDLTRAEMPDFDGSLTITATQAETLLNETAVLSPLIRLLGQVDFSAELTGPLKALSLTKTRLSQKSDTLTSAYKGNVSLAKGTPISGSLSLNSQNPRAILQALNRPLPAGETLNRFALEGQLSGTADAPRLSDIRFSLDDMEARGQIGADLHDGIPRLTAQLDMDQLDLSSFLNTSSGAKSAKPGMSEDWSDTPLDLAALSLVDADILISADQVKLDTITLSDATLATRLDKGQLRTQFEGLDRSPGFRAFDGDWSGTLFLDASEPQAQLELKAKADHVAARRFLGDLTGYTGLSGIGDVQLDLRSQGQTLKALVAGLDGQIRSDLKQGVLNGINLAKLVRSASNIQSLIRQNSLNPQSLREAISPEAETDFTEFTGHFRLDQGIAFIEDLTLDNPLVRVTGQGRINLGTREIDIRLTPSFDLQGEGKGRTFGLENIPLPVRISGPWTGIGFGFDLSAIQADLTRQARLRAGREIGNRIGGEMGSVLGGLVGGAQKNPDPSASQTQTEQSQTASETPSTPEQMLRERAVEGALGALFGRRTSDKDENDDKDD